MKVAADLKPVACGRLRAGRSRCWRFPPVRPRGAGLRVGDRLIAGCAFAEVACDRSHSVLT